MWLVDKTLKSNSSEKELMVLVPNSWSRDNCKTWPIETTSSDRTSNFL